MISAIYARKSTDQSATADEAKSVTRQIAHATAYAARKGWTVPEACIFVDDGISGAEFANRPGFVRLMAALKPRPPFQVLIMSEESRLGREAIETAYALKQLITNGVRVFFYLEDRERTFDSPTDKLLMSVTAFADELEREKARQRVYDAMTRKAAAGQVTDGRVFGYDNLEVLGTNGQRCARTSSGASTRPRQPSSRASGTIRSAGAAVRIHSASGRACWRLWPQRSRLRDWFQRITPRYNSRSSTARTEVWAHPTGRPCCGRGAGTLSALSVFVMRVRPAPAAHSSEIRRTTAASGS